MAQGNVVDAGTDKITNLVGTRENPGRDPKSLRKTEGKGSVGDKALMTAVAIVGIAWVLLIFLALSLRNHNV